MANLSIIRNLCKEKKISLTNLSSMLGISNNGLQRILNTNSTKIETLERISEILDVPITIFFENNYSGNSFPIPDFLNNHVPNILADRYDRVTDKISLFRDYYLFGILKDYGYGFNMPQFPFTVDGTKVNILSSEEESSLFKFRMAYLKTPFDKLNEHDQSLFRNCKLLFKGFYFSIFYLNYNNINDYMSEGFVSDKDLSFYWKQWNLLLNKTEGKFDV